MHPSLRLRPQVARLRFCRTGAAHPAAIRPRAHLATTVLPVGPARCACARTIRPTLGIFAHPQTRALHVAVFHACAAAPSSSAPATAPRAPSWADFFSCVTPLPESVMAAPPAFPKRRRSSPRFASHLLLRTRRMTSKLGFGCCLSYLE